MSEGSVMVYIKGGKSFVPVWWSTVAQACFMVSVTLLMTVWVVSGIEIDWLPVLDSMPVRAGSTAGFTGCSYSQSLSPHLVCVYYAGLCCVRTGWHICWRVKSKDLIRISSVLQL